MVRVVAVAMLFAAWLSACVDGMYLPRVVGGVVPPMAPFALSFQKQGQFGHTDYEQRKEDMIECGIARKWYGDDLHDIGGNRPGESDEEWRARRKWFFQCMKDKGYVQLGLGECGSLKENRGICK